MDEGVGYRDEERGVQKGECQGAPKAKDSQRSDMGIRPPVLAFFFSLSAVPSIQDHRCVVINKHFV